MKKRSISLLSTAVATIIASSSVVAAPETITQAIKDGKAYGDLRLRYESDDRSNSTDSDALTLRTRIGYKTAEFEGFSALVEFEDSREVLGIEEADDDALILDSEVTELDQGFIQYKNDMVTAKLGRQVIALDGQRHVGHVGWRQDRQTFDAARVIVKPMDGLTVDASYIYKVNRINSGAFADVPGSDIKLLNVAYQTPFGKAVVYNYEISGETYGAADGWDELSTIGASFTGSTLADEDLKVSYALEYATQDNDTKNASMDYMMAELGITTSGVTGKLGYSSLGSDDGNQSFATPLATVHKFEGWADAFLGQSLFGAGGGNGVVDTYASVSGKLAGVKLVGVYHDFETDEGSADAGSEIDLLAVKKFNKTYSGGLKYADYSAPTGGTDKTVMWAWVGMKF
jgi:Alginate export